MFADLGYPDAAECRAVPLAEQDDEVRSRARGLAAAQFLHADVHRLLVERGFLADSPAQVDGLEPAAVLLAEVAEPDEDVLLRWSLLTFRSLKVEWN